MRNISVNTRTHFALTRKRTFNTKTMGTVCPRRKRFPSNVRTTNLLRRLHNFTDTPVAVIASARSRYGATTRRASAVSYSLEGIFFFGILKYYYCLKTCLCKIRRDYRCLFDYRERRALRWFLVVNVYFPNRAAVGRPQKRCSPTRFTRTQQCGHSVKA